MASKNWRKVNTIFVVDEPKMKVFKKSSDLISKLDLTLTQYGHEANHSIESLKALRPFIRYFQIFGFFPISISPGDTSVWIKKKSSVWIFTTISFMITLTMTVRAIRSMIELSSSSSNSSASDEVSAINDIGYYIHTLSMMLIMIHRLHKLPKFFESCKRVEQLCIKYQPKNDNLVMHCWLVFGYFVCTQLIGNVLYYYAQGMYI